MFRKRGIVGLGVGCAGAIVWALLTPLDWALALPILHVAAGLGVIAEVGLGALREHDVLAWRPSVTRKAIWAWGALTLLGLAVLRFRFPDLAPDPLETIALPAANMAIRSLADVLLAVLLVRATFALLTLQRRALGIWGGLVAFLGVAALTAALVILRPDSFRDYIVVFQPKWNLGERAFGLFDLGNIIWLLGVIPLAIMSDVYPAESGELLRPLAKTRRSRYGVTIVSLAVVVAGILPDWTRGFRPDHLPVAWWLRKVISAGAAAGVAEELIWRGLLVAAFLYAFNDPKRPQRREWTAIAASSVLFSALHIPNGVPIVVGALLIGVGLGFLVVRFGLLWLAIAIHVALDTILLHWN